MTAKSLSQQLHDRYANDPDYQAAHIEIAPFEALTLQVVHYRCQAGLSQGQLAQNWEPVVPPLPGLNHWTMEK